MKVLITKYALTQGIQTHEAEIVDDGMICIRGVHTLSFDAYFHGNDWHQTKESAIRRANEMRRKKIASLEAQIKRLEKLRFED